MLTSLPVSAQNRLIGAALLALSLTWLLLPDLGLPESTETLGAFLFGAICGAGMAVVITGKSPWGLRRFIKRWGARSLLSR
jgi:hypothetical protein